ncbi:segregation/condensation protein A [Bacillus suaedaesalsae]|uniref:Segregation and condensation protein A n=1 Tax=Bacillus suaedaesalsae TaxID=2810349 RepID=A0ABS2DQ58_9BACI|nr:segregation/condensation protein A [Bacillus suaedaesalsae]MBM6619931.1 segregation/condensation protein A [Bacillus suaedaesalsae]
MNVQQYSVKLDAFEGPLDLLLHLINRYEIDIYDIPMAELTEQYLLYIYAMQELKLDVASEYLVMAATLLEIKSKMLLPKKEEELFDEDLELELGDDPREELMQRLIEYRKYKEAADDLKSLEEERGQMFTRPPSDLSEFNSDTQEAPLDVNIYDMLGAMQKLLRRKKLQRPLQTKITRQEIPIDVRMTQIIDELSQLKPNERKNFLQLFPYEDKEHIVVTFLALLELMKKNTIILDQENNFSDIFLSLK